MKYIGPIEFIQLNNWLNYMKFNLKDSKMKYIGPIKFIQLNNWLYHIKFIQYIIRVIMIKKLLKMKYESH